MTLFYMVECTLDPSLPDETWATFYNEMKTPETLLLVPGIRTAQRFKGLNNSRYAAIYEITDVDVMTSDDYKKINGGQFTSKYWADSVSNWYRNIFDGPGKTPVVEEDFVLVSSNDRRSAPGGVPFVWFKSVGLQKSVAERGLAAIPRSQAEAIDLADASVFVPRMKGIAK